MFTRSPATIPWFVAPSVTAASPVSTPARAWIPGPSDRTALTSSSADRTARSASSSCAVGAPQTAMTASPMNFSTTPPYRVITSLERSKYRLSSSRVSSASRPSARVVNPTRSANRIVTSRRSATGAIVERSVACGAGTPTAACPVARRAPHSLQNTASAGFGAPHVAHPSARRVPHRLQNLLPAAFSVPQSAQSTGTVSFIAPESRSVADGHESRRLASVA